MLEPLSSHHARHRHWLQLQLRAPHGGLLKQLPLLGEALWEEGGELGTHLVVPSRAGLGTRGQTVVKWARVSHLSWQ